MKVLIIGCGYVGQSVGSKLVSDGHEVVGIVRKTAEILKKTGIRPIVGDATSENFWQNIEQDFDWVINCISSSRGDTEVYKKVYLETSIRIIHWLHNTETKKYVYTSSSSVLGYTNGSVVDENTVPNPLNKKASILIETEEKLLEAVANKGVPNVIVRLSGIYGPDRGFLFKQFIKGEASFDPNNDRYINMIHKDDASSGIIAACKKGTPGSIYHITDSKPVLQSEFLKHLSEKLELPMPRGECQPKISKRAPTNKRISNHKAISELDWTLKYPTYVEGYKDEIERILRSR